MLFRICASLISLLLLATMSVARPLRSQDFTLETESEVALEIEAKSPGASWAKKDAEASALRIEVDGQYNQDLLLAAGDSAFTYRVMLGRLTAGKHHVAVVLNQARSAVAAQQATLLALRPILLAKDSHHTADDLLALAYSPVLYQRTNTIDHFSDLPLLMYYEVFHPGAGEVQIRYTTIFTNEDGGTATAALMARWGRAADIEWVYEFRVRDGRVVEETYQGVNHQTKVFRGERLNGNHPLLAVASDNNNFSDETKSIVRFALLPLPADLRDATRESVMDSNSWTYRLVAEELSREGKITAEPVDSNSISDPRDYVYVDLRAAQKATAIGVSVTSSKQTTPALSDLGEARLRIDRSGYFRT
ncbi:MAG TPA: hypothetical protein VKB46_09540, partial [Pyrinomonadaceae bacterium]|nr:hypothetical protein [Pyrinomonadaceae bacterium]